MSDLIDRQAAIDATSEIVFVEYEDTDPCKEEKIITQTKAAIRDRIKALPAVYVLEMNVGDIISRQAAMKMLMAQNVIMEGSEYHNGFNAGVNRAQEVIRNLPTVQPKQTNCEYCHTDRDGYVFPLEKNSHAFIDRDKIVLKANGWRGEAKIKYCPICGRRLTNG